MAVRLLKSLSTGVVLPYVEATLLSQEVREMTPAEVDEYMATITGKKVAAPAPVIESQPAEKPAAQVARGVTVTRDYSEGEPSAAEVLKALETD